MAAITLKGNAINTIGDLPSVGTTAPAFTLVKTDLSTISLTELRGQKVVLNIFPSIDTPVCANSTRRFNEIASEAGAAVLCISADLPFALARFCGAEGLDKVVPVSVFRAPEFGREYGLTITDGPIAGLLARAVVIIDDSGKVTYTELVPEIAQEPDYEAAVAALG